MKWKREVKGNPKPAPEPGSKQMGHVQQSHRYWKELCWTVWSEGLLKAAKEDGWSGQKQGLCWVQNRTDSGSV